MQISLDRFHCLYWISIKMKSLFKQQKIIHLFFLFSMIQHLFYLQCLFKMSHLFRIFLFLIINMFNWILNEIHRFISNWNHWREIYLIYLFIDSIIFLFSIRLFHLSMVQLSFVHPVKFFLSFFQLISILFTIWIDLKTNESIFKFYLDNEQTFNRQSIIFGLRELNDTEFDQYCINHLNITLFRTDQPMNFTSNYRIRLYQSGCYYFDENNQWKSDGLRVSSIE